MDEQQQQPSTNTPSLPPAREAAAAGAMTQTQHHTVMGVLSYLGILVIIPLLLSKDDPFVKFHAKQGALLAILEIALAFVVPMFFFATGLWIIYSLIRLALFVLSIIGIVNVVHGKEQELPVIGSWAKHLPL